MKVTGNAMGSRLISIGEPPYMEFPPLRALFMISSKGIPELKDSDKYSKELIDFEQKLLQKDPKQRPTDDEILMVNFFLNTMSLQLF